MGYAMTRASYANTKAVKLGYYIIYKYVYHTCKQIARCRATQRADDTTERSAQVDIAWVQLHKVAW